LPRQPLVILRFTNVAAALELLAAMDEAGVDEGATELGITDDAGVDEGATEDAAIELGAIEDAGVDDAALDDAGVELLPPPPPHAVSPRAISDRQKAR
jgi:hypothetical protein